MATWMPLKLTSLCEITWKLFQSGRWIGNIKCAFDAARLQTFDYDLNKVQFYNKCCNMRVGGRASSTCYFWKNERILLRRFSLLLLLFLTMYLQERISKYSACSVWRLQLCPPKLHKTIYLPGLNTRAFIANIYKHAYGTKEDATKVKHPLNRQGTL